jgi:hypothetical protein
MATGKAVGAVIDAPPLARAPHGLVNSLTLRPDVDRWEGGVAFESLACAASVDLWGVCNPTPVNLVDGAGKDRGVYAPSFGITATDTCTSTFGSDFRDRAAGRAEMLLEAASQKALESELKWGHVASTETPAGRWLTGPDTTVVDSTGVCPRTAVALLEDAYAACGYGGAGVLHLSPGAAEGLKLKADGDLLRTRYGTPVILGAGYAKTDADPSPWEGTWGFITGPVYVWLGDIQVFPDSIDQAVTIATNDIRFKAERLGAVAFDGCCVFAAKIDLAKIC